MSHYVKFDTCFRSKESLEKAITDLEALGVRVVRNGLVQGYLTRVRAEFGVDKREINGYARITNIEQRHHFAGVAFNFNDETSMFDLTQDALDIEKNAPVLTYIRKRYTRHETVKTMEAMGYRIVKETGNDIEFAPTRATSRHLRKRAVGKVKAALKTARRKRVVVGR